MSRYFDIHNMLFDYNGNVVNIVFDKDGEPWFNGIQVAKMLEYNNKKRALQTNVDNIYKKKLSDINQNYSSLYKNAQGNLIFINETGLNILIIKSRKPEAQNILIWIASEVLPSLRKTGQYKIKNVYQKELINLKKKYLALQKINKKMENNLKKNKYPNGGTIYIIKPFDGADNKFKLGQTKDLNKRKNVYNTSFPDNVEIVAAIQVDDPIAIELCVKGILHDYRYRDNKEYYKCNLQVMEDAIKLCIDIKEGNIFCTKCGKNINEFKFVKHNLERHVDMDDDHIYSFFVILDKDMIGGGFLYSKNYAKYFKYKYKYFKLICSI